MPLEIYNQVLSSTLLLLRQHYTHAVSPISAPGKSDYGDVDFLVCSPLSASYNLSITPPATVASNLSVLLGAAASNIEVGNPTVNLAVPWPITGEEGDEETKFVQIDVHTCPSVKIFDWELFHSAHGDLWNILGSTIRPFGFTVNDRGIFLRIPEIEPHDRKKSLIFLTDEPSQVLDLLGLAEPTWWKQFSSQENMFEYAASCRFFWVKEKSSSEQGEVLEGDLIVNCTIGAQEGGETGKKKLKHNDRQRMSKRPIFAAWIEDFIPKCREEGRFGNNTISRDSIRQEIFTKYPVQQEYESKLKDFLLVQHKEVLWRDIIKGSVPVEGVDPAFRAAAIRQFKAVIMEQEMWDGRYLELAMPNEGGFWDLDAVKKFVRKNWKKAGDLNVIRTQQRAMESMRMKAEKKRIAKEALAQSESQTVESVA